MRILVANVNTTTEMTEAMLRSARSVASDGTEVVGITPKFGAVSIEGYHESFVAAVAVQMAIREYSLPFDAVVQAGYGEHGREGLQEICDVPVVDITEAAASTAQYLGYKYSVITTLDRTVPLIEDRLLTAGLAARCASVRASGLSVLEIEHDPVATIDAIVGEAKRAISEDRAEVICLGCGGMGGLDAAVSEATGVPVVDGVAAAVLTAENLLRLNLTTSKVRAFASPRPKAMVYPLCE